MNINVNILKYVEISTVVIINVKLTKEEMRSIHGTLSTYSITASFVEIPSSLHDSMLDLKM